MNQWNYSVVLFLLLIAPLAANAQEIRYDTIKVSPADERNIHVVQDQRGISRDHLEKKQSQQEERPGSARASTQLFDRSKLRLGANLGLSASRNYTNLGFGPQVGYQFNNYFMAGAGLKYYYTRARTQDYVVKNNLLGANLFGYLYPVRFIALFVQPEINYTRSTLTYEYEVGEEPLISKGFVPSVVAGAGLRLGYTHLTINYDLVQHARSPHPTGFYMGISAFF